jgi:L-gulonate 3-dehydrogenase
MNINKVAVIGAGTIGRGWVPLFARAGMQVSVYDTLPGNRDAALEAAKHTLQHLSSLGTASSTPSDPHAALDLIHPVDSLQAALEGAQFVQESAPEDVALKREVLGQIDFFAAPDAIISTSCSSLDPSKIFASVTLPERCIVAHPFNPPHLLPLVELLVGPQTSETTLEATYALMKRLGQSPVILRKFVPGYVVNRLQAALINEAISLVGQGVIGPSDLDLCVTESLGRRWAFMGPFETMDLNADDGVQGYARRFRDGYAEIGADLDSDQPWSDQALSAIIASRRAELPLENLKARREWRDRLLLKMLAVPLREGND